MDQSLQLDKKNLSKTLYDIAEPIKFSNIIATPSLPCKKKYKDMLLFLNYLSVKLYFITLIYIIPFECFTF